MKISLVKPLSDYKLNVLFDDGVSGIVDLNDFIKNGIFKILQDKNLFAAVYSNGYSIAWSDELEIDALNIYAELLNKSPEDIFSAKYSYAAN